MVDRSGDGFGSHPAPPSARRLRPLDPVALLVDLPGEGLLRGQVGVIVEVLADGVFEVEFADDEGRTYAEAALEAPQLLKLHHDRRAA